jgi:myo-inositol-1-phosphate synthase
MFVGILGMTGIATVGGICAIQKGVVPEAYGTTDHLAFKGVSLVSAHSLHLGGWDYSSSLASRRASEYGHLPANIVSSIQDDQISLFPGIWTPFDYPLSSEHDAVRRPSSLSEGADMIADDIRTFRSKTRCKEVIVVFVGTPARECDISPHDFIFSVQQDAMLPSGVMYALGAINAGAHFIDFTPSRTLEFLDLWRLAETRGVQLAGRDGSTGQTMLKVTLAEMLMRRGIKIDAWYSTNLIGNRDGLVLSQADYAATKLSDKRDALNIANAGFHRVSIEYCPPWGDEKEAWDAIECSSWLGAPLSIRINWRGHDSQLAGALILDLIRLVELGARNGHKGFQSGLGFFFKRPFTREEMTISDRWSELIATYGH